MENVRINMDVVALVALVVTASFCVGSLFAFPGWRWPLLLAAALVVSLAFGVLLLRLSRGRRTDERLLKILAWSGLNTCLTLVVLLAGLAVLGDVGLLPWSTVGIGEALEGGMVIMTAVFALWYAYYFIRGDVA